MGTPIIAILLLALLILALVLLVTSLRVAIQYERAVVFRLGRYNRTAGPGLYFLIPVIEWKQTLDLRTKTATVETP